MILDGPAARWRSNPVVRLCAVLLLVFPINNYWLSGKIAQGEPPLHLEYLEVCVAMGMVGAQAALYSIWAVFNSWRGVSRFLVSLTTVTMLFMSLFVRLWIDHPYARRDVFTALLCLPLIATALQAPLWILKVSRRWQIVPPGGVDGCARMRTLRIRDLFAATGWIAIAFAAVRLAGSMDGSDEFLVGWGLASVIISIASLLVIVVALLATLRAPLVMASTLLAVTFQAGLYLAWLVIMCMIFRSAPPFEALFMLFWMFVGFIVFLYGPLIYLRYHGYRLR